MRAPCNACGFRLDTYDGLCQRCELENAARLESFDVEQWDLDRRYPPTDPWAESDAYWGAVEEVNR